MLLEKQAPEIVRSQRSEHCVDDSAAGALSTNLHWRSLKMEYSLLGGLGGLLGSLYLDGLFNNYLLNGCFLTSHGSCLAGNSLLLADGVLVSSGLTLGIELGLTDSLGLGFVNGFNKNVFVLVCVTLGSEVEGVVHVLVNFLLVTVFLEESSQNTGATHP